MWFPIVNRRGKSLDLWAFYTYDPVFSSDSGGGWHSFGQRNPGWFGTVFTVPVYHRTIGNNKASDLGFPHEQMLFFIQGAVIAGPWTIHQGDYLVITPNGYQQAVVSIQTAFRDVWGRSHGKQVATPKLPPSDDTLAKVMGIALNVLGAVAGAVATGISVPSGKAGGFRGLGRPPWTGSGRLSSRPGLGSSPAARDRLPHQIWAEIKTALAEVLQEDNASRAASLFAENYDYFSSLGDQIAGIEGRPPQPLVDQLDDFVNNALDPTHEDSFREQT